MRNRKEAKNKTWTRLVVTGTLIVGVAQVTAIGMGTTIYQGKGANDRTMSHNAAILNSTLKATAFYIGASNDRDTSKYTVSPAQSAPSVTVEGTGVAIAYAEPEDGLAANLDMSLEPCLRLDEFDMRNHNSGRDDAWKSHNKVAPLWPIARTSECTGYKIPQHR